MDEVTNTNKTDFFVIARAGKIDVTKTSTYHLTKKQQVRSDIRQSTGQRDTQQEEKKQDAIKGSKTSSGYINKKKVQSIPCW